MANEVRGSRGLGLCLKTLHSGALEATLEAGQWVERDWAGVASLRDD